MINEVCYMFLGLKLFLLAAFQKNMEIIDSMLSLEGLKTMARNRFGNLVKAVVDVEREIMAVDGELHSDEEALLLENGSLQQNLWGVNIYPELEEKDWIEFDSIINIRPSQGNRSRGVDDPALREKIVKIIFNLVKK
jgi:hypothetical protein